MKSHFWNNPKLFRRLLAILTTLLVLSLAMHPELRLLVPLLDAAGIDVLVTLLGLQTLSLFSESLLPYLRMLWQRLLPCLLATGRAAAAIPGMRTFFSFCSDLLLFGSGYLGQFAWLKLWSWWQWALRPDNSFKPDPFRRSA
ncbi:hypothetical protein [Luteimonas lutimaris]|uniref:Uncharacterized protein n=1 Tax=Luteimonas lutimaris TaxID=698645 RepID=A0ABP7MTB2_9GAMM